MARARQDAPPEASELKRMEAFINMPYGGIQDKYQFLSDAYYGDGGFEDGGYIVPHPRETYVKLCRRRMLAYYFNYVKTCVHGNVDPIFKELPVRDFSAGNQFFAGFLDDCDCKGTSINRFMKRASLKARLLGVSAIVVDNFTADELGKFTLSGALQHRKYPYIYHVEPNKIMDFAFDQLGNLSMIEIETVNTDVDGEGKKRTSSSRLVWTNTTVIRRIDGGGAEVYPNKIGMIPVVLLFGAEPKENEIKPTSEFFQLAKTNLAIYNACSELRELLRSQAFNILTYALSDEDDFEKARELIVSVENVLLWKGTAGHPPAYIAPSAIPAEMLMNEIKMLVEEIYRMANLASVTGVQQKASGVAKEWDFETTNMSLADFAKNIEQAESRVAKIFGAYIGVDLQFKARYSEGFGIVDVSDKLDDITKSLALMIGGDFDREAKKMAARALFKSLDDKDINTILSDIDSRAKDEIYTKAEDIKSGDKGDVDEI